jgi:eukaryotic-like serine/threonine-protein kinase
MIEKVWANWITGWLQASLPQDLLLDLGLTERPTMVTQPLDLLVQRPNLADRVQAPGTQLIDVFNRLDRALLILGAPGAGKTTLLLQLTQDLLRQAAQDPQQPIPVVFLLSSWAQQRVPLADWLVDALYVQYEIPRKIGQAWVKEDEILPLLDGLDEVQVEYRAACVEAMNRFRWGNSLRPLVICSRIEAYEGLGTQLRLQGALSVQPLMRVDVDNYLVQVGASMAAVGQAVQDDPTLWELLDTPLMLEVVTLACAGTAGEALRTQGTLAERRQHLFATYVDRMFRRRGASPLYTRQQTEHWLTWLAVQMTQHGQTVFHLERMQLTWLPYRLRSKLKNFRRCTTMRVGLLIGLLTMLTAGPLIGLFAALAPGAGVCVGTIRSLREGNEELQRRAAAAGIRVGGGRSLKDIWDDLGYRAAIGEQDPHVMMQGLIMWLLTSEEIISIETLHWSWSALEPWQWHSLLIIMPILGLISGLGIGLGTWSPSG